MNEQQTVWRWLVSWCGAHPGLTGGATIGLLLGLLLLIVGFWKMVLFAIIVGCGVFVGVAIDRPTLRQRGITWILNRWNRR